MGLSPQIFSLMKERIDDNHPWVTDDVVDVDISLLKIKFNLI